MNYIIIHIFIKIIIYPAFYLSLNKLILYLREIFLNNQIKSYFFLKNVIHNSKI